MQHSPQKNLHLCMHVGIIGPQMLMIEQHHVEHILVLRQELLIHALQKQPCCLGPTVVVIRCNICSTETAGRHDTRRTHVNPAVLRHALRAGTAEVLKQALAKAPPTAGEPGCESGAARLPLRVPAPPGCSPVLLTQTRHKALTLGHGYDTRAGIHRIQSHVCAHAHATLCSPQHDVKNRAVPAQNSAAQHSTAARSEHAGCSRTFGCKPRLLAARLSHGVAPKPSTLTSGLLHRLRCALTRRTPAAGLRDSLGVYL